MAIHGSSGNELFYHGSTYLEGDGSKIDLDGATAKYYVCAISFLAASTFSTDPEGLCILDGGVNLGLGNTHFISSQDTQKLDDDWGAETDAGDNDGKVISNQSFPAGLTIYGMWDYVELDSGACICYVAPRPDYMTRSAALK